jgi:hypothetical protein
MGKRYRRDRLKRQTRFMAISGKILEFRVWLSCCNQHKINYSNRTKHPMTFLFTSWRRRVETSKLNVAWRLKVKWGYSKIRWID